jgi:hypothetical protein
MKRSRLKVSKKYFGRRLHAVDFLAAVMGFSYHLERILPATPPSNTESAPKLSNDS